MWSIFFIRHDQILILAWIKRENLVKVLAQHCIMREVTATVMTGFDGGNAADFRIHPGREAALMHHHPRVPTKPGVPSHPTALPLSQTSEAEPLRQQPQVWFGGPFSACSK